MDCPPEKTQAGVQPAANRKAVIKKIAARATTASAKLENRQVPAGHVRSAGVQRLLSERQGREHRPR